VNRNRNSERNKKVRDWMTTLEGGRRQMKKSRPPPQKRQVDDLLLRVEELAELLGGKSIHHFLGKVNKHFRSPHQRNVIDT